VSYAQKLKLSHYAMLQCTYNGFDYTSKNRLLCSCYAWLCCYSLWD